MNKSALMGHRDVETDTAFHKNSHMYKLSYCRELTVA